MYLTLKHYLVPGK